MGSDTGYKCRGPYLGPRVRIPTGYLVDVWDQTQYLWAASRDALTTTLRCPNVIRLLQTNPI